MEQKTTIQGDLGVAVNNLSSAIRFSEPVNRFLIAREGFQSDENTHRIMEDLSAMQVEIRHKQIENNVSSEDLERLRFLQNAAQENEVISTYAYAQQEAIGYLREINVEINNLLGMDFAMLAKKSGC